MIFLVYGFDCRVVALLSLFFMLLREIFFFEISRASNYLEIKKLFFVPHPIRTSEGFFLTERSL